MAEDLDFLTEAGFTHDEGMTSAAEDSSKHMSTSGPYIIHGIYVRGQVSVKVEENTDTRLEDGMKTMTTYPATAIISGPKGTVAAPISDPGLVLRMADELG